MVHLLGRLGCQPDLGAAPPPDSSLSTATLAENVDSPHADAAELSRVLVGGQVTLDLTTRIGDEVPIAGRQDATFTATGVRVCLLMGEWWGRCEAPPR